MPLTLTVRQCLSALSGLTALSRNEFPLALAIKIARLRFAVQLLVDPVHEAREQFIRQLATGPEGTIPAVTRLDDGRLTYAITAEAQYLAEREYEAATAATVTLDAEPLRRGDFPALLRGVELTIAPDVVLSLGPLFLE